MEGFEIAGWICSDWSFARKFNTQDDWKDVCAELYGACQACISTAENNDYDDYKTLLLIAREHRFNARSAE